MTKIYHPNGVPRGRLLAKMRQCFSERGWPWRVTQATKTMERHARALDDAEKANPTLYRKLLICWSPLRARATDAALARRVRTRDIDQFSRQRRNDDRLLDALERYARREEDKTNMVSNYRRPMSRAADEANADLQAAYDARRTGSTQARAIDRIEMPEDGWGVHQTPYHGLSTHGGRANDGRRLTDLEMAEGGASALLAHWVGR